MFDCLRGLVQRARGGGEGGETPEITFSLPYLTIDWRRGGGQESKIGNLPDFSFLRLASLGFE